MGQAASLRAGGAQGATVEVQLHREKEERQQEKEAFEQEASILFLFYGTYVNVNVTCRLKCLS
jgi:hypothetical protein